jgi:uncharacterized surface protein with fasciclin (FAS1) repeats
MYRFAPLVLACLAVPALGARQLQMNNTVVDLAVATPSLSTLVTAVTTADLATALSDPNATLTVFAPDNDAFAALAPGLLTTLLTPGFQMHLKRVLLYHVFSDAAILSTALAASQNITMMNGEMLTVTKSDTTVTVTTTDGQMATVIMADVEGSNGVVHIIDGVLMPNIMVTVIALDDNYSTLLSLIALAGLEATLMRGPFTLLAPNNEAFAELDTETVDFLTSDAGLPTLTSILVYHVIPGSVTSDMLMNDMMVKTVQGGMVTFMVEGGTVMVNDATVVMADILALNGVSHAIDKVLMPPPNPLVPSVPSIPSMAPMSGMSASMSPDMTPTMAPTLAPTMTITPTMAAPVMAAPIMPPTIAPTLAPTITITPTMAAPVMTPMSGMAGMDGMGASMVPTMIPMSGMGASMAPTMTPMSGTGASTTAQTSDMSGSLAVGASLSAVFAAVLAVVL